MYCRFKNRSTLKLSSSEIVQNSISLNKLKLISENEKYLTLYISFIKFYLAKSSAYYPEGNNDIVENRMHHVTLSKNHPSKRNEGRLNARILVVGNN